MIDFRLTINCIIEELQDTVIIIKDHVIVKVINSFDLKFEIYIIVFNEKTRNEKTLPNLDSLLKSLEEEKIRMTEKTSLNNIQASFSSGFFQGGLRIWGYRGRRSRNSQGRRSDWAGGKRRNSIISDYKDITCHYYQKKDILLIIIQSQYQYQKMITRMAKASKLFNLGPLHFLK